MTDNPSPTREHLFEPVTGARTVYGPGQPVPAGVDLAVTVGPWWTVTAVDRVWNHVAAMQVDWSDPAGGPGHWVPLPNGEALLIVTSHALNRRHPTLDKTRHASPAAAMQVAWSAGLLGVIVFPDLKRRAVARQQPGQLTGRVA